MGTATERPHGLTTEAGLLLPCYHRVRFPDSAAFVAGSLQTFVGDFRPEHFQSPGCRLVRVPFSVVGSPRHCSVFHTACGAECGDNMFLDVEKGRSASTVAEGGPPPCARRRQ